ncbi:MAG: hypothetical protein ACYC1Z_13605 [Georgenia sp.]
MTLQEELDEAIGEVRYVLRKLEALRQKQLDQQVAPPSVIAGPLSFLEVRRDRLSAERESRVLTHPTCGIPCATCDDELPGAAA